ncbi:hypothetical protein SAMN05518801_10325 [Novosphingobium sp. CF614]|uniref:hypothetical protein n=1 Tax=Novosphingobium sp. CF614 TaxID=1884364 RepID=UPI0008ECAA72|nr:hypothetical protein [Novosphingobium sp. CF614]SFF90046.1 hypothetical protein SAMN05518801_10325 [Novosphingobium sp. CF614]
MRRALPIAALFIALPFAAPAVAQTLSIQIGQWYQVFAPDIERAIGRSISVDAASVTAGGLGRQFREAQVLLRAERQYPRGTTVLQDRSVDCAGSLAATTHTRILYPTGVLAGEWATPNAVQAVHWDSQDGKVLKFVCQGILPR